MSGLPPMHPGRSVRALAAPIEDIASDSTLTNLKSARSRLMKDEIRPQFPLQMAQKPVRGKVTDQLKKKLEPSTGLPPLHPRRKSVIVVPKAISMEELAKVSARSRLMQDEARPQSPTADPAGAIPVGSLAAKPMQPAQVKRIVDPKVESVRSLSLCVTQPIFKFGETEAMPRPIARSANLPVEVIRGESSQNVPQPSSSQRMMMISSDSSHVLPCTATPFKQSSAINQLKRETPRTKLFDQTHRKGFVEPCLRYRAPNHADENMRENSQRSMRNC